MMQKTITAEDKDDTRRVHSSKLQKLCCRTDRRLYFFSFRVVDWWNKIPQEVIEAPSIDAFKNCLDNHFEDYLVMYNYRTLDNPVKPQMTISWSRAASHRKAISYIAELSIIYYYHYYSVLSRCHEVVTLDLSQLAMLWRLGSPPHAWLATVNWWFMQCWHYLSRHHESFWHHSPQMPIEETGSMWHKIVLKWIEGFLTGSRQRVIIKGTASTCRVSFHWGSNPRC